MPRARPLPSALLGLHERLQVGDGPLHRPCALHDLGQEHPTRPEEVADDGHPVHQRPLDDVERPVELTAGLLGVLLDVVHDPVDERIGEPLLDGRLAPGEVDLPLRSLAVHRRRERDEALGRVGTPVEDHVFDVLQQVLRDVLVDGELAGVDDAHVEAGLDRVEEEGRVHGLAHDLVPAEGKGEVGDAPGDLRAGAALLDARNGLDEGLREARMLFHPGGDGEDVRVEDDVLGREAHFVDEQPERALADLHLAIGGVGLAGLVEGHDDDAGAVAAHEACLREKVLGPPSGSAS